MASQVKLLAAYTKMLEKERQLCVEFREKIDSIIVDRTKVAAALSKTDEIEKIPDIICQDDPYLAWQLGVKNDAYAIQLFRNIRDAVQASNRDAKDHEAQQNFFKEKIANWLLDSLNKSGHKSVNCGEAGKAYKKMKVRVSPADWDGLLKWVAENDAGDAIQKRVNSSFVTKYEEEHEELPPFLNISREYEVIVTK